MSGGSVGDRLWAQTNGMVYLDGTGFQVNGQALDYGDKLSNFVPLVENGDYDYYTGEVESYETEHLGVFLEDVGSTDTNFLVGEEISVFVDEAVFKPVTQSAPMKHAGRPVSESNRITCEQVVGRLYFSGFPGK